MQGAGGLEGGAGVGDHLGDDLLYGLLALLVCRTDFQGRRIIAFPELEFETATESPADAV